MSTLSRSWIRASERVHPHSCLLDTSIYPRAVTLHRSQVCSPGTHSRGLGYHSNLPGHRGDRSRSQQGVYHHGITLCTGARTRTRQLEEKMRTGRSRECYGAKMRMGKENRMIQKIMKYILWSIKNPLCEERILLFISCFF